VGKTSSHLLPLLDYGKEMTVRRISERDGNGIRGKEIRQETGEGRVL
jgi:hypothetical protein